MAAQQITIKQELKHIRTDLEYIKHLLAEDFELSNEARAALKEARETVESEYVDLE